MHNPFFIAKKPHATKFKNSKIQKFKMARNQISAKVESLTRDIHAKEHEMICFPERTYEIRHDIAMMLSKIEKLEAASTLILRDNIRETCMKAAADKAPMPIM